MQIKEQWALCKLYGAFLACFLCFSHFIEMIRCCHFLFTLLWTYTDQGHNGSVPCTALTSKSAACSDIATGMIRRIYLSGYITNSSILKKKTKRNLAKLVISRSKDALPNAGGEPMSSAVFLLCMSRSSPFPMGNKPHWNFWNDPAPRQRTWGARGASYLQGCVCGLLCWLW